MAERIGRLLEKRGLIERDAQSAWLNVPRLTSTVVQWMLPVRMPRAFAPRGGRG
jgi:hypothetical protein